MTGLVLAFGHPHGAASTAGTGTYWFAIGLLVGVVAAMVAPGWVTGLVVLFDLVALGWMTGILGYAHKSTGRWVLIALPFLLIGLYVGVARGLRHLSDSEFNTRLTNIRRMGKYF
jgi:putative effector of murein hydrolase LrgA (UPF0299 family)